MEVFIDCNGPPIHLVDGMGTRSHDRYFNGGKWHFVSAISRAESEVTRRFKLVKAKLLFSEIIISSLIINV